MHTQASLLQSTYLHVGSIADHHDANGDGFFLLGIGQFMLLHFTMVQMAYFVQLTKEMGEALARNLNID